MSEIKHSKHAKGGDFYYEAAGEKMASMVYVMDGPEKMIIEHTEVDESLKGQGIGKQLLAALVDYVREQHIKVVPLCPFANVMFQKTKEWQDVLS